MNTGNKLTCFKAYDVRGRLGKELNEEIAYRIGRATAQALEANTVALGYDARQTSPTLARAVAKGVCHAGADVLDIGLAGTEEIYSSVSLFNIDAGIEVTASHNPIDYNGMKIVKREAQPLSDQEFVRIKYISEENDFISPQRMGSTTDYSEKARDAYIDKILSFVNLQSLKPLKILINCGNGAAGPTIDLLQRRLTEKNVKSNLVCINNQPDSSFPNGIPNPLLKENRKETIDMITREKADFGVAFDGDFDRCFFFDQSGDFVSGEYMVGLISEIFLKREKGASIVHDPRVIWNTIDAVKKCHGNPVVAKTGHAFLKATMRNVKAVYGGEVSAHHYFRDFAYCDSGMIPWLMVWEFLSKEKLPFSEVIANRKSRFVSSGELNFTVSDAANCLNTLKTSLSPDALLTDDLDGLSMSFENWRFNLRQSNTEPLVRLNVETRGDLLLLQEKTQELKNFIKKCVT